MSEKPLILTVDSNSRNLELLNQFLTKQGYQTIGVSSLEELDRQLSELSEIKLVILDIAGARSHYLGTLRTTAKSTNSLFGYLA